MKSLILMINRNKKILYQALKYDPFLFCMQIINIIFNTFIVITNILSQKYLINIIKVGYIQNLLYLLSIVAIVNVGYHIFYLKFTPFLQLRTEKMNVKIIDNFLKKNISLNIDYFEQNNSYNNYQLAFNNCCSIFHKSINSFLTVFSSLLQIISYAFILMWINKIIFVFMILIIIVQTLIANNVKKIQYILQKNLIKENKQVNFLYRLFYIPQFLREVRINNLKKFIFNKKNESCQRILETIYSNNKKISKINFVQNLINVIENFFLLLYFSIQVIKGKIWFDSLFVSINSYNGLKGAFSNFISVINNIYENDLYIQAYMEFMNEVNDEISGNIRISAEKIKNIEFKNVYFKYLNANQYILKDVSFNIKKGEKVGIYGSNGAGKTTMIKLLLRLYTPTSGEILLNGLDICKYNIQDIRNSFSVLSQDYTIFPFTIKENLLLGRTVGTNYINEVLKKFQIFDKINSLDEKLNTPITNQLLDKGIELSGGENQKLALVRTYLRNNIFILDEPTTSLDNSISENIVDSFINKNENILIIISHKHDILCKMSKIIFLDKGSVTKIEESPYENKR
ncbi:ABC transporter ATP-binding protein [Treponema denticola]|uniref:ATP-binding cassette domain-containing protein n=1 Tax=Treponema denticola TaxID=158 RepID=UPI0020A5DC72|nr:ABC transporter ATP-binding protein [Treponema denticola]UTD08248.1 ABC transporter ATP-binding protein [Treponema denticola]